MSLPILSVIEEHTNIASRKNLLKEGLCAWLKRHLVNEFLGVPQREDLLRAQPKLAVLNIAKLTER
jgi:hypothetical protein